MDKLKSFTRKNADQISFLRRENDGIKSGNFFSYNELTDEI